MMHSIKQLLLGLIAACVVLAGWTLPANAEYYTGKTITLISPVPGGSGLDRLTRSFARYWPKHIPGQPKMIVKNMPGGGFAKALNFVYEKARPDGLTLVWSPWKAAGILAGEPGIRFVPEKFVLIGSGQAYYVTLMRADVPPGIKKGADVVKAQTFNVGGRSASVVLDVLGNLSMEMIGAKYRFISGYRGMNKINPAFRSNEVQAANSGHIGYHVFFKDTLIKSGEAIALWYHPTFDIDGNIEPRSGAFPPNVKSFVEVYEEVHGKKPSGPLWEAYKWYSMVPAGMSMTVFAAPGSSKEAVAVLQKAHLATTKDSAYLDQERKRLGVPIRFISLEQALNNMRTYKNVSPQAIEVFKKMAKVGTRRAKKGGKKKK